MHTFYAMNTELHTSGLDRPTQLRTEAWFSFIEKHLSRFNTMSELSQLNKEAGRPFFASPLLVRAVYTAMQYYRTTQGLFNPFLGGILTHLGYNQKMDWTAPSLPVAYRTANTNHNGHLLNEIPVTIDSILSSIRIPRQAQLDLGGIAKGWSTEQFALLLQKEGISSGMIDAGGDIVIWNTEGHEYVIDLADPYHPEQNIMTVHIDHSVGIATSSVMKRKWNDEHGETLHHIIDPRTLEPAQSDLVQVTVIAPSLTDAEVYAKCVLILGSEAGSSWLQRQCPQAAMVAVCKDQSMITAGELEQYQMKQKGGAVYDSSTW